MKRYMLRTVKEGWWYRRLNAQAYNLTDYQSSGDKFTLMGLRGALMELLCADYIADAFEVVVLKEKAK